MSKNKRILMLMEAQPIQSKIVVLSIFKSIKNNKADVYVTYQKYINLCKKHDIKILSYRKFSDLISELEMFEIISRKKRSIKLEILEMFKKELINDLNKSFKE